MVDDRDDPPPLDAESGDEPGPDAFDVVIEERRSRLRIAVAITLIAAIVVFGAVGGRIATGEPGSPTDPPAVPRLAIIGPTGALSTIRSNGSTLVPYPAPDIVFGFPAWSPDGSRIATIGTSGSETGVYVFTARADVTTAQSKPTVVYQTTNRAPFYLLWGPDGRQLTFLTTEPDTIALRVAPADGSAPDTIVRKGAPLYWDWLDPSRLIAHVGSSGPDAFLGEVGLGGGGGTASTSAPLGLFRAPAISRDGAFRGYVATGGATFGQVVVESGDGGSRHEIPIFSIAALNFDPAGRRLGFIAAAQPKADPGGIPLGPLRVADAASGETRTLLEGQVVAFFWSPDGTTIAALRVDEGGGDDIVQVQPRVTADLAAARTVPDPTRPPPAADGLDMVLSFVDVASGKTRSERLVHLAETFVFQLLPYFDQYALSHRIWSPDSTAIALPIASDTQATGVFAFAADGAEPLRLLDGELGFWSP